MFQGLGWGKIKETAEYSGVSPRTVRSWLRKGLPYSRIPGGCVLIKFSDLDEWLKKFNQTGDIVDQVAGEVLREFGK
jgi:excisionase family DNA binding protein